MLKGLSLSSPDVPYGFGFSSRYKSRFVLCVSGITAVSSWDSPFYFLIRNSQNKELSAEAFVPHSVQFCHPLCIANVKAKVFPSGGF